MSRASGVPLDQLRPYLFLLRDRDATGHLLRVAGGLDSLVMGEGQILAQVKQVRSIHPSIYPSKAGSCSTHTAHVAWHAAALCNVDAAGL